MDLRILQEQFVEALLQPQAKHEVDKWIAAHSSQCAADKIKIYSQSRLGRLTKVLKATYPVCQAIVGESYFKKLSYDYAMLFIDNNPDVSFYGKNFPQFLAQIKTDHALEYLSDIAKLEWACFCVLTEKSGEGIDATLLSSIPADQYLQLKFHLTNAQLLSSDYPILTIWQQHQESLDNFKEINLAQGGCQLIIYRCQWELKIEPLTSAEFLLLDCFEQNQTLAQTWQACDTTFPEVVFAALFAKAVKHGWINFKPS